MKREILFSIIFFLWLAIPFCTYGQGKLRVSVPLIWSEVEVKDNWTPTTAVGYKEFLSGNAFGYGVDLIYSFHPGFIIRDKHFSINVGGGYFNQTFNIERPFNYRTQLFPAYYTDSYLYHSWQGIFGLTYARSFNKYALTAGVSYRVLRSFRQEYTPTYGPSSYGFFTQTNHQQIDFARMLFFDVGISRYLGDRFLVGVDIIAPAYTRWRNDTIFDDDAATFSKPKFSFGTSLHVSYRFKSTKSP
jgi:hypothetical protein